MVVATDVIVNNEVELVSMELAKKHLRLDAEYEEEDVLVDLAIASAITQVENYTERKVRNSLFVVTLNSSDSFVVERNSVNDRIKEVRLLEEGVDSIILPVTSSKMIKRGPEHYEISFVEVELNLGQTLEVDIEFGFTIESLPKDIISAILLLIGDSYEKREDRGQGVNTAVKNLLRPYRKWI